MRQGRRYGLSAEQKADIWRRWKAGESLHEIGRAIGKDHGSIQFLLSQRGGIVPAVRRRSVRTLTLAEREDISRGIASGSSIREIARGLQRAPKLVQVTIDGKLKTIQAGTYTVAELKRVLGVDPSRVLDEVIGGEFKELPDNGTVHIKKGEIFVSHVRQGQSS